jgi:hypothetical protein
MALLPALRAKKLNKVRVAAAAACRACMVTCRACWCVLTLRCVQLEAFSCVALGPLLCCPQVSEDYVCPGSIQLAAGRHSTAQRGSRTYWRSVLLLSNCTQAAELREGAVWGSCRRPRIPGPAGQ